MKHKLFIFTGVILAVVLSVQFISCNNQELDESSLVRSSTKNALQEYAYIHNLGLECIRLDAQKTSGDYTRTRLDSVFKKFVICQYGKAKADKVLREIDPIGELVFIGTIPSLRHTRGDEKNAHGNLENTLAQKALNECMVKIANQMNSVPEEELFDNPSLLEDLHAIINETYATCDKLCNSDADSQILVRTLGVLYGSIEYWSNSNNVNSWQMINLSENDKTLTRVETTLVPTIVMKTEAKKQDDDKKLSKSEYIQTVAAADAIGALAGAPAAVACSAAAALYFEVE